MKKHNYVNGPAVEYGWSKHMVLVKAVERWEGIDPAIVEWCRRMLKEIIRHD